MKAARVIARAVVTGVRSVPASTVMVAPRVASASAWVPRVPLVARSFSSGGITTVSVPAMGDSITEGTVNAWNKAKGDWVNQDDIILTIETDKVTVDVRAPVPGFIEETLAPQGQTIAVGTPIVKIRAGEKPAGAPAAAPAKAEPAPAAAAPKATPAASQPATPAAPSPAPAAAKPAASAPSPKPAVDGPAVGRSEHRVAMTSMRKRIAQRLKESQNTAAMLTTFQECDMSAMFELRDKYKEQFEKTHGVKLGFMSIFVKAAAAALKEVPVINAVIDGGDLVYRNYVDVSVAVASPRGLVVPVLRNVENLSMAGIELALAELAKKARNDKITMEDMTGGTFTISNGGVFGSLMGTPIINPPQSAILGMHAIKDRAVVVKGKVEIRPVMYLALTYDHRLIDGREAVTFLASLRDKVEDPRRILLDL